MNSKYLWFILCVIVFAISAAMVESKDIELAINEYLIENVSSPGCETNIAAARKWLAELESKGRIARIPHNSVIKQLHTFIELGDVENDCSPKSYQVFLANNGLEHAKTIQQSPRGRINVVVNGFIARHARKCIPVYEHQYKNVFIDFDEKTRTFFETLQQEDRKARERYPKTRIRFPVAMMRTLEIVGADDPDIGYIAEQVDPKSRGAKEIGLKVVGMIERLVVPHCYEFSTKTTALLDSYKLGSSATYIKNPALESGLSIREMCRLWLPKRNLYGKSDWKILSSR